MALNVPAGVEVVGGYNSPESIAKRMLAHREMLNSKTKLTWDDEAEPIYSTHRMIGQVNLSAPYMRFGTGVYGKYYWLQNGKWFLGNGGETTLDDICVNEAHNPTLVNTLYKAEKIFAEDAASRDPNICKHCLRFRSKTQDDYFKHLWNMHPDRVAAMAGAPAEEAPVAATEPVPETTIDASLACCGKFFKDKRSLGAHKRFSKAEHGA